MTQHTKAEYLRIALALQKIVLTTETADRIIETYEKVLKEQGNFSIRDAVEIQMKMDRKYAEKELKKGD